VLLPIAVLREPAPDAREQDRRRGERDRVDEECSVAAEDRGDDAAEGRSHREHRPPQRAAERVRRREVGRIDHVRDRGGRRGVEDRGEKRKDGQQDVREPEIARADREEGDTDPRPSDVAHDHEPPAVEPVGEPAGPRRRDEDRELLGDDQEADGDRLAGHLQDEPPERHEQEPVASERDHGRDEEPPEVAVPAEERGRSGCSGRVLSLPPFGHGLSD